MDRNQIHKFLEFEIHNGKVHYDTLETIHEERFVRHLIEYSGSEKDRIKAYLFIPNGPSILGSVLVHHQHNSERHLGKSEVAGITGDPMQFFCTPLAEKGIITLAPDSISFEDRRRNTSGILPTDDPDDDVLQHYNEMAYRLLKGTTLMKKVIDDSSIAVSLLSGFSKKIGILGHSYGGNTVIFHSPFDDRIQYTCSSGAVCSYRNKFENETGIELAEVIPNFVKYYDIDDLLKLIAPRELLIVSADQDIYAQDAPQIYQNIKRYFDKPLGGSGLKLKHVEGQHALDRDRFEFIINWFVDRFSE